MPNERLEQQLGLFDCRIKRPLENFVPLVYFYRQMGNIFSKLFS